MAPPSVQRQARAPTKTRSENKYAKKQALDAPRDSYDHNSAHTHTHIYIDCKQIWSRRRVRERTRKCVVQYPCCSFHLPIHRRTACSFLSPQLGVFSWPISEKSAGMCMLVCVALFSILTHRATQQRHTIFGRNSLLVRQLAVFPTYTYSFCFEILLLF